VSNPPHGPREGPAGRILVVEDEDTLRVVIQEVLEEHGCDVLAAASAEDGLALLEKDRGVSVALLDLVLPGMNGLEMLGEIKKASPGTEVMMMTSHSSVDTVIEAIRQGAYDYLEKPFDDVEEIWLAVRRVLEKTELARRNEELVAEQTRRNEELSATVDRLSSLNEASRAMNECGTLDELLDFFAGAVARQLGVDRVSLMLVTEDGEELEVAAHRGVDYGSIADVRMPLGSGIAGRVAATGRHILVTDVASDPRVESNHESLSNSFISAPIVLSVPIKSISRVLGVINVTNRRSGRPFDEGDVEHVRAVASQLAVAIERARHLESLQHAYESLASTQDQLVFSERLKAVGQMAAGVAHDFNNALSIILGRSQTARRLLATTDEVDRERLAAHLESIERVALQGAEMIRRVQDYTRIRRDAPDEMVDLQRVVREAVDMTRPKWMQESYSRGAEIEVRYDCPEPAHVLGNFHELTQVVSNLIFNAVEAMPDGGSLSFRTTVEDQRVLLDVSDTGTGMDEETRAHVFEPFFTTKDSGNGLGTSIVYGIVARHGGEISVHESDARGTTFRISLPRVRECGKRGPEAESAPYDGAPLRILLAEDDDEVRDTYAEALGEHGHEVVPAVDGSEAIRLLGESRFDVVITDHSMPGRTGLDVARSATELDPPVPVILLSGFAMQEEPERIRDCGVRVALTKPCPLGQLLGKVREVLRDPEES
jgi:signal transduction histidine kinase/DNA-binding response OmpR family regulator